MSLTRKVVGGVEMRTSGRFVGNFRPMPALWDSSFRYNCQLDEHLVSAWSDRGALACKKQRAVDVSECARKYIGSTEVREDRGE
jgi:hypothetical protein